jgi:hypothetical protein
MEITPISIVIGLAFAAASFALARWLSARGHGKRREQDRAKRLATETRQQRRARERRERKR